MQSVEALTVGWYPPPQHQLGEGTIMVEQRRGAVDTHLALRALHLGDDEGWFGFTASHPTHDHHVVMLEGGRYRTVSAHETVPYVRGHADGWDYGHLIDALVGEATPELVTFAEAAELLPPADASRGGSVTVQGVEANITGGARFWVLYGASHRRYLYLAQVTAEAARRRHVAAQTAGQPTAASRKVADRAAAKWDQIRGGLPPRILTADIGEPVTPQPSPTPLPIPEGQTERERQIQALRIGHRRKWFTYDGIVDGGYQVQVGDTAPQLIAPADVLAWTLGVADRHGKGRLVAYREGLG